ncbi:MAG: DotU family type IV/VI secretion system protein [Myxococcales bacterium]|nr:DotU family type IV/VI secretion system protein [Myxococcales bacterium]
MEQSIGVFGQDVLLWVCLLRQTPARPAPQLVHQHANWLLDELRSSSEATKLPIQSVDDGLFAIAALIDEIAMNLPDLRPFWSQYLLQATRHNTSSAGVELFEKLRRVRQGPKCVLATYMTVIGLGFMGAYGYPGADPYAVVQLRRELALELGVDADRDCRSGVLRRVDPAEFDGLNLDGVPWWKTVRTGRVLGACLLAAALIWVFLVFAA